MEKKIKKFIEENPGCTHEQIAGGLGVILPVDPFAALNLINTKQVIQRGNEFYPGTFTNTDILKHRAANRGKKKPAVNMIDTLKKSVAAAEEKKPKAPEKREVTKAAAKKKKTKKKGLFGKRK